MYSLYHRNVWVRYVKGAQIGLYYLLRSQLMIQSIGTEYKCSRGSLDLLILKRTMEEKVRRWDCKLLAASLFIIVAASDTVGLLMMAETGSSAGR